MNPKQLKNLIIIPTLTKIDLLSDSAVALLLGTCAQETNLVQDLIQQPHGPALGPYQMEPITSHNLIVWLSGRPVLKEKVDSLVSIGNQNTDRLEELVFNLAYATAMARLRYLAWNDEPLPAANDILGLAKYYKKYYNTPNGAATERQFIINYHHYVEGKV